MYHYDEPVKDYASHFKDLHATNVSEYFEELVRASKVDEKQNVKTVAELRALETAVSASGSRRMWWVGARVASFLAIAILVATSFQGGWNLLFLIPAIGLGALVIWKLNPAVADLNTEINDLESSRDRKAAEAWAEMEPLNSLFRWDMARDLVRKTLPAMELDAFLSSQRLLDLEQTYGLSADFMKGRSVTFPQSGSLGHNPFVITKYIQHWIGTRSYSGSLVIQWEEKTMGLRGRFVTVQRSETLTAKVQKPDPKFRGRATILYGHEAAPRLSFSRTPSNLSGSEKGVVSDRRKSSAVKEIERRANKQLKSGQGQLTVMANREFEALFNALNRDHEIEFRLLFTPLAQQEMVNLLNDSSVGYGDNFSFAKQSLMHIVEPDHLGGVRLDADPQLFRNLELQEARAFFNKFHNEYFKGIFFAFAPILTIPLLREARSLPLPAIDKDMRELSVWELESMVNLAGEAHFKHTESVTQNLLKTEILEARESGTKIRVSALGYKGIPRVDHVEVLGGDGKKHQVPVQWTEYVAVEKSSPAFVGFVPTTSSPASDDDAPETSRIEELLAKSAVQSQKILTRDSLFVAI